MIHADFDTNISRQDILVDSDRNIHLLYWIASTFVLAARQFCEQKDTLISYEWPLFLPTTDKSHNRFWSVLDEGIQAGIKAVPLFRSHKWSNLRQLHELCILPPYARLGNGEPVLQDATQDIYLSSRYSEEVKSKLRQPAYGLAQLNFDTFLALLRQDLACNDSKMRDSATSDEWHTVVAKQLTQIRRTRDIDDLELLPLQNGRWVTSKNAPVYLPTIDKISIPAGLDLQVLSPSAVANDARTELFLRLGAAEATFNTVRIAILMGFQGSRFDRLSLVSPLRFLYETSPPRMEMHKFEPIGVFENIYLGSSDQRWYVKPSQTDIYLPGDSDPYGPAILLSDCDTIAPIYAEPILLEDPPLRPSEKHPTWLQWLHGCIGIRSRLRLLNAENTELSEISSYVLSHNPFKFLGLLEHLWKDLPTTLKTNISLRQHIGKIDVKSICSFKYEMPLQESYFPLKSLREEVEQYMENPAAFPFLEIESPSDSFTVIPWKWLFLHTDFHVRTNNDLQFLLDILWWTWSDNSDDSDDHNGSENSCGDSDSSEQFRNLSFSQDSEGSQYSYESAGSGRVVVLSTLQLQKLCDLYRAIYAKLVQSKDIAQERNTVMSVNTLKLLIITKANLS